MRQITWFLKSGYKYYWQIKDGEAPTCVVMDSKGYSGANADNLKQITFISRVPNIFSLVGETIDKACLMMTGI